MSETSTLFFERCPLSKGDPVSKVKAFYGITFDPTKLDSPSPGGTMYQYHFTEYGVWIFFDARKLINSLRFDAPFAGKIGEIAIGDHKDKVVHLKGSPVRQFEGFLDTEVIKQRDQRKREILADLPDPASKDLVMQAFNEIAQLDTLSIARTAACVYDPSEEFFVRYDFGSLSNTVQIILSSVGTGKASLTPSEEKQLTCSAYREAGHAVLWYECYRKLKAQITSFAETPAELEDLVAISLPSFERVTIENEGENWQITTSSLASLNNVAYVLLGGYIAEQKYFGEPETEAQGRLMSIIRQIYGLYITELMGDGEKQQKQSEPNAWHKFYVDVNNELSANWIAVENIARLLLQTYTLDKPTVIRIIEQLNSGSAHESSIG